MVLYSVLFYTPHLINSQPFLKLTILETNHNKIHPTNKKGKNLTLYLCPWRPITTKKRRILNERTKTNFFHQCCEEETLRNVVVKT